MIFQITVEASSFQVMLSQTQNLGIKTNTSSSFLLSVSHMLYILPIIPCQDYIYSINPTWLFFMWVSVTGNKHSYKSLPMWTSPCVVWNNFVFANSSIVFVICLFICLLFVSWTWFKTIVNGLISICLFFPIVYMLKTPIQKQIPSYWEVCYTVYFWFPLVLISVLVCNPMVVV